MIAYKTIKDMATADYEINKSHFIAQLQRTANEKEVQNFIESVRKKYYDAKHNCTAYVIGVRCDKKKFDDDGEPSGTAGHPILEVLEKNCLSDVTAVVTRYFGGIKLGAGGLIRAYGHTASLAVSQAQLVMRTPFTKVSLRFGYDLTGCMENFLRKNNIEIIKKEYNDAVSFAVLIKTDIKEQILSAITEMTAANCVIDEIEEIYHDVTIKSK